jgi:hypothetical protein
MNAGTMRKRVNCRRGAKARMTKLTPAQRSAVAKKAAAAGGGTSPNNVGAVDTCVSRWGKGHDR